MNRILELLLYIFCLCPFLVPIKILETDIQPFAFGVSFLYLMINMNWIRLYTKTLKIIFAYFLLACVIAICSLNEPNVFRSFFCYVSLFFVTLAVTILFVKRGFDEKICKIIILAWFIVGLIQTFAIPDFGNQLVSGGRTTLDRGAFGLASEPSFYGVQCFYFLYIVAHFKENKWLFAVICLIMAFVFAQSFTGLLFICAVLVPYLSLVFSSLKSVKYNVYFIIAGLIVFAVFQNFFEGQRLAFLLSTSRLGMDAMLEDQSTSVRFYAIVDAIEKCSDNYFFPSGFEHRYGTMFGGILVEMGFLAIPLLLMITNRFSSIFSGSIIYYIAFGLLFCVFFSNIQLTSPTLAFVLALLSTHKIQSIIYSPTNER